MNFGQNLGVQSYCFRHVKDNKKVAALIRECALDRVEICGVHVDFKAPETFESVIADYREAGVSIESVGVQLLSNKETEERGAFDFARLAGAKSMSVTFAIDSVPAAYRTAEKLAEEYDISLCIHNHGGYDWLGNATSLAHALAGTSNRIGLCLDTAWAQDSGFVPTDLAARFADRLYGVHIKDFVFDRARQSSDVIVGSGNLDLPLLMRQINNNPAVRYAVLEYEKEGGDLLTALKECVAAVRAASA